MKFIIFLFSNIRKVADLYFPSPSDFFALPFSRFLTLAIYIISIMAYTALYKD